MLNDEQSELVWYHETSDLHSIRSQPVDLVAIKKQESACARLGAISYLAKR